MLLFCGVNQLGVQVMVQEMGVSQYGCGSKSSSRGKPRVLVHVSTYQGNPFWNSGFLSHCHMELFPLAWPCHRALLEGSPAIQDLTLRRSLVSWLRRSDRNSKKHPERLAEFSFETTLTKTPKEHALPHVWVKKGYPNWNPGNWKHGLKPARPWFRFDPIPTWAQVFVGFVFGTSKNEPTPG